jgi:molybdopterin/thiamine biosynthesis adenylyltransferase
MLLNEINNVIVIGAGGTGSFLIPALGRYLFSKDFLGKLTLIDGDSYSTSNINRQNFHLSAIGMNKAEYQAAVLNKYLPAFADHVFFVDDYLSKEEIQELCVEKTVIFNCADNNAIRKYADDAIAQLNDGIHICCGNELLTGQVHVFIRHEGQNVTKSVMEMTPEFNTHNDDRSEMSCQELEALPSGGQIIIANMMSATLALSKFVQIFEDDCFYQQYKCPPAGITWFDIASNGFLDEHKEEVKWNKKKESNLVTA